MILPAFQFILVSETEGYGVRDMAGTAENSKREGVVREIEAQILSGKLKPGARLEAERELALRFGLSRSSVNLGMLELERKGFVRIVPRKGAFVSDFLHEATPQTLSVIMEYGSSQMDESLLHDLMDMRALIECECARLACLSGRGPADTELPRLMAAIRSSSGTEQIEAICDYHYHLTKLSGNDVYAMTFKAFHGPLRGLTSEHYRSAAERKRSVKLHADLTAAIGAGDAEAASRLVGEIIMRADENLSGKKRRR